MVFSSNVFLFLFLPIFLGLYYLSGQRYRNLLLLIASYVFYAWWRVDFLALFAAVTLWNKMAGQSAGAPPQWLSTHPSHANRQRDLGEYAARVMPLYQGARR